MSGHCQASEKRHVYAVALSVLVLALVLPGCTRPRPGPIEVPSPSPQLTVEVSSGEKILSERALVIGDKPDIVPGQVIVKLESDPAREALDAEVGAGGIIATGVDNIDRLNQEFGVKGFDPLIKPVAAASGETVAVMAARQPAIMGLYVVSYAATKDPDTVAIAYRSEPNVVYAEPNYYAYASETQCAPLALTPNDPYFDRQWNLEAIQASQAWDLSQGQGVTVAVVDSGIAYEDFEGYRRAPDLSSTKFVPGFDFVNNSPHANDDYGHGTHVAGTIAQSTNNAFGVAGVAFGAALMPVKVLDSHGQGGFDALAQGIIFAADHGARVINLSLSGRKTSQLMTDAIRYATGRGVLIVAAAGNSGGAVEYPAAHDEVLAVGSVDYQLNRAQYSDFGPQIAVVAPGGDTSSDRNGDGQPDGVLQETFRGSDPTQFGLYYLEGTSMAAPHVSGVAALLFAFNPNATAAEVRQVIETTARDLGTAGRDNEFGYGLVQAAAALAAMGAEIPTATPAPVETTPVPSPTTPAPKETTPAPSATPPPEETTPVPTPTPTPEGTTPAPSATPVPEETTPAPSPTTETPEETTPGPSPTTLAPAETAAPSSPTALAPVETTPLPSATGLPTNAIPSAIPGVSETPVTPPTTTTPIALGGEDLIVNGGFEGEVGWVFSQTQVPGASATEVTHSGARSARLGIVAGYDSYSYSSVHQVISIPAGVRRATLTFWTYPISDDLYPNDLQLVLVLDEDFLVVRYAEQSLSNARQWVPGSLDLTELAGRTVVVYFGVYNGGDTGRTSAMYVDDVVLTVER